jgi:hypothetical protein
MQGLLDFEAAEERWLAVEGWPGYDVSDYGRVRTWWRWRHMGRNGLEWLRDGMPSILPSWNVPYPMVNLKRQDGARQSAYIHLLVLEAFVGPRPTPRHQACHSPDPDKANVRLSNLRWGSQSENNIDRLQHGRPKTSVLSEDEARRICSRLMAGERPGLIAEDMRIKVHLVRSIRKGESWRYISETIDGWGWWRRTSSRRGLHLPDVARRQRGKLLDEGRVAEIKEGLRGGRSRKELAMLHGVSAVTICHIANGRTWSEVG